MRPRSVAVTSIAAAAGLAVAVVAAVAVARSFTLQVGKNVNVNGKHESVVVSSRGISLYTLGGETKNHLLCSGACLSFWPPYKVGARQKETAAPGVRGTLGKVHRGSFFQVTLNGHPLYRFQPDNNKAGVANGDGMQFSAGHVWHVIRVASGSHTTTTTTTSSSNSTTTTTTTTTSSSSSSTCLYPPYCY